MNTSNHNSTQTHQTTTAHKHIKTQQHTNTSQHNNIYTSLWLGIWTERHASVTSAPPAVWPAGRREIHTLHLTTQDLSVCLKTRGQIVSQIYFSESSPFYLTILHYSGPHQETSDVTGALPLAVSVCLTVLLRVILHLPPSLSNLEDNLCRKSTSRKVHQSTWQVHLSSFE